MKYSSHKYLYNDNFNLKIFQTMNLHILIQLFLLLILLNYISYVHSASSSSAFATAIKYKNPKLDKTVTNRKNKGGTDDDTDADDEGSKSIKAYMTYFFSIIHEYCLLLNQKLKYTEDSFKSLLNNITLIKYRNR